MKRSHVDIVLTVFAIVAICAAVLVLTMTCVRAGCDGPDMLKAEQAQTCTQAQLGWEKWPGATSYNIYEDGFLVCSNPIQTCAVQLTTVPGSSYTFTARPVVAGVEGPAGKALTLTPNCTGASHNGIGTKPVLVVLVNFPDHSEQPQTSVETAALLGRAAAWVSAQSFGAYTITPRVVGYMTAPASISTYCTIPPADPGGVWFACSGGWSKLDAQAEPLYGPLSAYSHVEYFWSGVGIRREGNQDRSWHSFVNSGFTLNAVAHSLGHAAGGMLHAGYWRCNWNGTSYPDVGASLLTPNTGGCFANRFSGRDPLGDSNYNGDLPDDYAAFDKVLAGWIPSSEPVTAGVGTASYRIGAVTLPYVAGAPREIRIPLGMKDWFYSLDYSPAIGVRAWVHVGPGMGSVWADGDLFAVNHNAPVTLADPLTDTYRGITVKLVSITPTVATVTITGAFP